MKTYCIVATVANVYEGSEKMIKTAASIHIIDTPLGPRAYIVTLKSFVLLIGSQIVVDVIIN